MVAPPQRKADSSPVPITRLSAETSANSTPVCGVTPTEAQLFGALSSTGPPVPATQAVLVSTPPVLVACTVSVMPGVVASTASARLLLVQVTVTGRDGKPVPDSRLLTARSCLGGRLWVTHFHMEALRSGHRVEAVGEPRYWEALRPHADTIVIDAPAADRNEVVALSV